MGKHRERQLARPLAASAVEWKESQGLDAMKIDGHWATVSVDADSGRFRGEFIGLSGGADFYAETILALAAEGRASLRVYLDLCREKGVEPFRGDRSQALDDQVD
jgi:hypothetical protein